MEGIEVLGAGPSTPTRSSGSARKRARSASPLEEDEKDSSQPTELDELYVTMRTDVVGIQYYNGLVGRGETVMLKRDADNAYDANAVKVVNASQTQVGHIPRAVAARLAPLMDGKVIAVEGVMVGQNLDGSRHFKLGIDMSIYARASHRSVLEPELAWATPGQLGFDHLRSLQAQGIDHNATNPTKKDPRFKGKGRVLGGDTGVGGNGSGVGLPDGEAEVRRLLDGLRKVGEDEKHVDGVMDSLTADIDVAKLPLHSSPPGIGNGQLVVDLLPHQSQGLQWMVSREYPKLPTQTTDPPVQFWTLQSQEKAVNASYWLNVATRTPQSDVPELGRGGIMADGMGLGKTLTTLALVLATKKEKTAGEGSQATLIVCPLSVISNWEKQIADHVVPGGLSWYTYHGAGKGVTASTLSDHDTVATDAPAASFSATPVKGKKSKTSSRQAGPLFKVKWKRVVADEGHVLKNAKAKMTMAFCGLQAERRWVCTGTPIVNSPADLGSLLTCIKVCKPLDHPDYFKSLLLRPLKNGDPKAGKLLQALVGQILLRRTKESKDSAGKRLVELPGIEYFQCLVKLDEQSRELYDAIQREVSRRFEESLHSGETTHNVLSMLTRMRQLCLSKELIPNGYLEDLQQRPEKENGHAVPAAAISEERKAELIEKLRLAVVDSEECPVCYDVLNDPRITDCGHPCMIKSPLARVPSLMPSLVCLACVTEVIIRSNKCPMDRHPITMASLLDLPPEIKAEWVEPKPLEPIKSAKITELVKYLKVFDKSDKSLVFSQFTSFLNHVATALKEEGIPFVRFDGSMNAKQRQEVISTFQRPVPVKGNAKAPLVMLISLKSGAVGLNLTAASNVFLCDPWWQSAIEAQAIDRVHRMGQRKAVRVFQLIAEDTVESKVLDIQKRKDALVAHAFEKTGKETVKAKKEARFEELKELFGVK
ncbi:hypothetical protein P7C73_g1286, partial [Tremellales sp. Uapishka_1]